MNQAVDSSPKRPAALATSSGDSAKPIDPLVTNTAIAVPGRDRPAVCATIAPGGWKAATPRPPSTRTTASGRPSTRGGVGTSATSGPCGPWPQAPHDLAERLVELLDAQQSRHAGQHHERDGDAGADADDLQQGGVTRQQPSRHPRVQTPRGAAHHGTRDGDPDQRGDQPPAFEMTQPAAQQHEQQPGIE